MAKKLHIINKMFTITDTITGVVEFKHLASETYHQIIAGFYHFYYDTLESDDIVKVRTKDYLLTDFVDPNGDVFPTDQDLIDWLKENIAISGGIVSLSTLSDYVAEYENDSYIYSGYLLNSIPEIKRTINSVVELAQGVTNLATDWPNRLSLTYI